MCLIFNGTFSALIGIVSLSRNQRSQQLCHLRVTHWANSRVRSNHYVSTFLDVFGPDPIDQHAFRSIPEVGAAPDMINDDLPSNPDYLDVSFGTAAGLRELDDDDLDTDDSSQSELTGIANLHSHPTDKNVVSSVGGETIKVLDPSGLQTVENFFNTLPALVEVSPQCVSLGFMHPSDVNHYLVLRRSWIALSYVTGTLRCSFMRATTGLQPVRPSKTR